MLFKLLDIFILTILINGRFEPSSKTCSICGYRNQGLTLDVRQWTCEGCKTRHDRDVNAAIIVITENINTS